MKKFLLTLGLALALNFTYAQKRAVDWSVESIDAPTALNSTSGGTSFAYDFVVKNNGTDSVFTTDTMVFQLVIAEGNTAIIAYPNLNQYIITPITRDLGAGDTLHLRGTLSTTYKLPLSKNVRCIITSFVINNTSNGIFNETSVTNNQKISNMTWTNQYGWGVSVADISVNELSIYPNPATDEVVITPGVEDVSEKTELTITDMTGRIVYHEVVNLNNGVVVNVADFTAGIYNVNLKNGKLSTFGKLIVR